MTRERLKLEDAHLLDLAEYIHLEHAATSPVTSFAEPLTLLSTPDSADITAAARIRQWQAQSTSSKITDESVLLEQREVELLARIQTLESTNERNNETIEVLAGRLRQVEHVIGKNDTVLFQTIDPVVEAKTHLIPLSGNDHGLPASTQPRKGTHRSDLYGDVTLSVAPPPRPLAPRSRAVSIDNLPQSMNSEVLLRIVRGGPVEQIFYAQHAKNAVVWFIYPDSAEACVAFAATNNLVIDNAHITFSLYETDLSRSPPSFDVADAPNHGISNTINIKGVHRNTKTLVKDFDAYGIVIVFGLTLGTVMTIQRLKSGTVRVVYSSIHDAIIAYQNVIKDSSFATDNVYYGRDECASAPSRYLLDHSSSAIQTQTVAESLPTINPALILKQAQRDTSYTNLSVEEQKHGTISSNQAQAVPINPQLIRFKKRRGPHGDSYVVAHPGNTRTDANREVLGQRSCNPPMRPAKPEKPCKICGSRHWFAGPQSTPCIRRDTHYMKASTGNRRKHQRSRSASYSTMSDKENAACPHRPHI